MKTFISLEIDFRGTKHRLVFLCGWVLGGRATYVSAGRREWVELAPKRRVRFKKWYERRISIYISVLRVFLCTPFLN